MMFLLLFDGLSLVLYVINYFTPVLLMVIDLCDVGSVGISKYVFRMSFVRFVDVVFLS